MTHLATAKEKIVATTQGGAHNSKVTVSSNPISLTNVGKKKLKLKERLMLVRMTASHQTLKSLIASTKPLESPASLFLGSITPILFSTSCCSSSVSHLDVFGKSGRTKKATTAKKMVKEPLI